MAHKQFELKSTLSKAPDVGGLGEMQAKMDEDLERGFRGVKVDPIPNSAFSQETDPTMSPGHDRIRHAEIDQFRDPNDPTTPTGTLDLTPPGEDKKDNKVKKDA